MCRDINDTTIISIGRWSVRKIDKDFDRMKTKMNLKNKSKNREIVDRIKDVYKSKKRKYKTKRID